MLNPCGYILNLQRDLYKFLRTYSDLTIYHLVRKGEGQSLEKKLPEKVKKLPEKLHYRNRYHICKLISTRR